MSMKNTTRRIFSAVTAGVMLSVSAGAPVPFAHPVSFAEEAQQGDTLSAVAWLYLNAGKLDEAAYAMAYEQLGVTGQELLEQLRTGLLVLCRAADGTYYTKLAEEMTEADTPAVPDAVDEQPMEPTVEEPKAEEPEQPDLPDENLEPDVGMEEPEVEEPVVEEPEVEEPEVEEPVVEEPEVEEPVVEEPEVEEPEVEEPEVEEPEVEEPVVEEPVVEEPAVEEPVVEEPVVEEPAVQEPVVTEAPAVEEPAQEEPVVEEPVVEEPVVKEPVVEEPIVEEPVEEETQQPAAPTPAPMGRHGSLHLLRNKQPAAPTPAPMVASYAAQANDEANDAPAVASPTADADPTTAPGTTDAPAADPTPNGEDLASISGRVEVGTYTYNGADQAADILGSLRFYYKPDGVNEYDWTKYVTFALKDTTEAKNAGTYEVTVKPNGSNLVNEFAGSTFRIAAAPLNETTLQMNSNAYSNLIYANASFKESIEGSLNLTYKVDETKQLSLTAADVTIAYTLEGKSTENVINAGNYQMTITGTGNYDGKVTVGFAVSCRELNKLNLTYTLNDVTYDGKDHMQALLGGLGLSADDVPLTENDVTLKFVQNDEEVTEIKNVGVYTLRMEGKGNYSTTVEKDIEVKPRALAGNEMEVTVDNFTYTGGDLSEAIWKSIALRNVATEEDLKIKDHIESELEYAFYDGENLLSEVVDAGTYTIKVTPNDDSNYDSGRSFSFDVTVAPYELTYTAYGYVNVGQDIAYVRSDGDVGASKLVFQNYKGKAGNTVELRMEQDAKDGKPEDAQYVTAIITATTSDQVDSKVANQGSQVLNLTTSTTPVLGVTEDKAKAENYVVTGCKLVCVVREYVPKAEDVKFSEKAATSNWPVVVENSGNTWYNNKQITFTAEGFKLAYVENGTDPAPATYDSFQSAYEWKHDDHVEGNKRDDTKAQTFYFYLRNANEGDDDYNSVTRDAWADENVYYDSANITNVSNQVTITPRDATVTLTNDGGEAAYVYVTYDSGNMQQTQPDPLTQPGKSIPMNGGSGEYKLNLNAQGDETQRTNVYQDEKTGTQESQVNYLPTGAKVLVYAYDEAGNEAKTIELTVTAKEVAGLTASSTQYTLTKYTLANKDENVSVISADTPAYTLSGEPNEIVEIKYADKTFYIRLDAEGKATVDMVNFVGVQPKDDNEKQVHEIQQVTFSYPEAYPTAADKKPEIQVKQGEATTVTCSFIYDTYAFPVSATLETNNRSRTLSVTLPEDASCVKVYRVQDDREIGTLGSLGSPLKGNQPYDVNNLIWNGSELLHSGNETLYIKYWDLAGNVSSAALVNLTQARVATPITITEMEPVVNENGYYGGQFNLLRVTGTAHPCELIHVTIPGVLDTTDTVSGDPATYTAETNAAGVWTIYINLKMLPQNEKLQMTAHYDDVVGEGDAREFTSDRVCYPSMLLTPIDENTKVISGIAEPGAVVTLLYNGERVKANVNGYGVFTLAMPMTFAGDTVTLQTVDMGGNVDKQTFEVGDEQTNVTLKGYMLGQLSTTMDKKDADPDWLMSGNYSRAELEQGVTVSLVAANAFKFGEIHIKMDEQGMVTYDYDLDEGVTVDSSYFTVAEKRDVDAMLAHELPGYDRGVAFDPAVKGKNMWISAEFVVTMPADKLESTFLTDKESELYKEYFARMRNSSMLKKAEK